MLGRGERQTNKLSCTLQTPAQTIKGEASSEEESDFKSLSEAGSDFGLGEEEQGQSDELATPSKRARKATGSATSTPRRRMKSDVPASPSSGKTPASAVS